MIEKTNTIQLRLATAQDAGLLNTWWNDGSLMALMGFPYGLQESLEQTLAVIANSDAKQNPLFIIEIDGNPVGELNYTIKDGIAYPGWKICNPAYQNKGYGPVLILRVFASLFEQVDTISWDTMLENTRAQFVYETKIKARKTNVQKDAWKDQLGNWRTAVYYEMKKEEFLKLHPDYAAKHQASLFDQWSQNYDTSVQEADRQDRYPFAGYFAIQKELVHIASLYEQPVILDIGIGTGALEQQLPSDATITGLDFSLEMLEQAKGKHPNLTTIHHNFAFGLPASLHHAAFDVVFCNYAIHHLQPKQQQALIADVLAHLKPNGKLIIADVMTATEDEMDHIRQQDQELWDDEEYYLIVQDLQYWFPDLSIGYQKMSYCSGIIMIQNN